MIQSSFYQYISDQIVPMHQIIISYVENSLPTTKFLYNSKFPMDTMLILLWTCVTWVLVFRIVCMKCRGLQRNSSVRCIMEQLPRKHLRYKVSLFTGNWKRFQLSELTSLFMRYTKSNLLFNLGYWRTWMLNILKQFRQTAPILLFNRIWK